MDRKDLSPLLFQPAQIRSVALKNRIVISPMCQYSANEGMANDWHVVHLGKLASGGAGLVFTEATAVAREGRITHGDLGLWSDAHMEPLRRIIAFMKSQGAVPAMQLAHAGRKASMQRPWHGNGPLNDSDRQRGEDVWPIVAPSAIPLGEGWLTPSELSLEDIRQLRRAWKDATLRALDIGIEVLEVHGAHGYLLHEFLSPLSNRRTDAYGGSFDNRVRLAIEIIDDVRTVWPESKPLFLRLSSVDGIDGGWTIQDSVALAKLAKSHGIDVIDCSSGGLMGSATAANAKRTRGFQVPFAEQIRREADIMTMAVGLILDAPQAESVLQSGAADLIAIGREALYDPNWALHAEAALGIENEFISWPAQYGWWLDKRTKNSVLK